MHQEVQYKKSCDSIDIFTTFNRLFSSQALKKPSTSLITSLSNLKHFIFYSTIGSTWPSRRTILTKWSDECQAHAKKFYYFLRQNRSAWWYWSDDRFVAVPFPFSNGMCLLLIMLHVDIVFKTRLFYGFGSWTAHFTARMWVVTLLANI